MGFSHFWDSHTLASATMDLLSHCQIWIEEKGGPPMRRGQLSAWGTHTGFSNSPLTWFSTNPLILSWGSQISFFENLRNKRKLYTHFFQSGLSLTHRYISILSIKEPHIHFGFTFHLTLSFSLSHSYHHHRQTQDEQPPNNQNRTVIPYTLNSFLSSLHFISPWNSFTQPCELHSTTMIFSTFELTKNLKQPLLIYSLWSTLHTQKLQS